MKSWRKIFCKKLKKNFRKNLLEIMKKIFLKKFFKKFTWNRSEKNFCRNFAQIFRIFVRHKRRYTHMKARQKLALPIFCASNGQPQRCEIEIRNRFFEKVENFRLIFWKYSDRRVHLTNKKYVSATRGGYHVRKFETQRTFTKKISS